MEGSLIISVGSRFQALMTRIEREYRCVDVCLYFYIFIRKAVSRMGAWDYKIFWQRNI